MLMASSAVISSLTVIGRFVIIVSTVSALILWITPRTSRRDTIPTSFPFGPTTGTPPMPCISIRFATNPIVVSGVTYRTSRSITFSAFLTRSTKATSCSAVQFRCKTPIPPARARAIAIADSVTVSMAELTSGIDRGMFFENFDFTSTSLGSVQDSAGSISTSSNVNAVGILSFSQYMLLT